MTGPHDLSDPYLAAVIREVRGMREELARLEMTEAQREWSRQADERCPVCGRLGFGFRCSDCDRS